MLWCERGGFAEGKVFVHATDRADCPPPFWRIAIWVNSAERHAPAAFQHLPTSDSKHQEHCSTQDVSEENQQKHTQSCWSQEFLDQATTWANMESLTFLLFIFFPANSFGRVAQKMPEMTTFTPPSTPFQSLRTTNQHHNGLGLGRKTQEQLASLRKVKTLRKRGLDKFSSPSLVLVKLLRFANLKVSGNAWEYCQLPSLVLKLGFFEWFLFLNNLGKAKMRPLQIAHVYACLVAGDNPEPGHTENRFLYYVNSFPMGSMYASMHLDSWFLW